MSLAPFTASATELVAMANSPLPMRRKPYLVCVPGALSCRVMPVRITVPSAPSKNGSRSQMRTSWPASAQSAPHVLPTAPPPSTAMGALRNSSTLTNSTTSYYQCAGTYRASITRNRHCSIRKKTPGVALRGALPGALRIRNKSTTRPRKPTPPGRYPGFPAIGFLYSWLSLRKIAPITCAASSRLLGSRIERRWRRAAW